MREEVNLHMGKQTIFVFQILPDGMMSDKVDHALGISLGLIRREEWKESDGDAEKLDQAV